MARGSKKEARSMRNAKKGKYVRQRIRTEQNKLRRQEKQRRLRAG